MNPSLMNVIQVEKHTRHTRKIITIEYNRNFGPRLNKLYFREAKKKKQQKLCHRKIKTKYRLSFHLRLHCGLMQEADKK